MLAAHTSTTCAIAHQFIERHLGRDAKVYFLVGSKNFLHQNKNVLCEPFWFSNNPDLGVEAVVDIIEAINKSNSEQVHHSDKFQWETTAQHGPLPKTRNAIYVHRKMERMFGGGQAW